jgi:acetylornithine/succinyldiaminopimelate/putrescine aminotransferase
MLEHVRREGQWLGDQLAALAVRSPKVRAVRGRGLMWGVDVTEPAKDVVGRALEKGLILVSAGDHTLRLLPPLVMTRADLVEGVAKLEAAIG